MELIIAGVVLLVLFAIGREVVCWYAKINLRVEILGRIEQNLIDINKRLHTSNTIARTIHSSVLKPRPCPNCGTENPFGQSKCLKCKQGLKWD